MMTHGFRKWYANQCSRAHIDYPTREYLIGHRLPGQEPSYNRMTEEDRLAEYVKAIPYLTINPNQRLKDEIQQINHKHSEEWGVLKEEVKELKQLLAWIGDGNPRPKKEQLQRKMMNKLQDEVGYELQREYYEDQGP
jgi:hypothetical protein